MKVVRVLGLKNIVYNAEGWKFLLFYDIDGDAEKLAQHIQKDDRFRRLTWLLYSTKHGAHLVSITPLRADTWGMLYEHLLTVQPALYSGQTIRLSRKADEQQQLIDYHDAGNGIERLWNLYAHRFGISYHPSGFDTDGYRLVYETYKTKKE